MDRMYMTDVASMITARIASAFASATAGGAGNNTEVVGVAIDRAAFGSVPLCGEIEIPFEAVLGAGDTFSITGLQVEDSADGAAWATYEALTAPGVVATGPAGGGTVRGQVTADINLSSARRYIRIDHTPVLSAAATDTAKTLAVLVLGGFDELPAPV